MFVTMQITFNGTQKKTIGAVIGETDDCWLVDFENNGVGFRGLWPKLSALIVQTKVGGR